MIQIFEQGESHGLGYTYDTFITRFREICKDHIDAKRAHAFALIFYDFKNKPIRNILKSQGGFTTLDRLSGSKLSVFYLHSNNVQLCDRFNEAFKYIFEIDEKVNLPFVLFLKFDGGIENIIDLRISILEQSNPLFAFKELYDTIEKYVNMIDIEIESTSPKNNKLNNLLKKYGKMAIDEFVRQILRNWYKTEMFD